MRVIVLFVFLLQFSVAGLTRLEVERTELILDGKARFALDPTLAANAAIVDLKLAPRNAQGLVECSADFFGLPDTESPARTNITTFANLFPYPVDNLVGAMVFIHDLESFLL